MWSIQSWRRLIEPRFFPRRAHPWRKGELEAFLPEGEIWIVGRIILDQRPPAFEQELALLKKTPLFFSGVFHTATDGFMMRQLSVRRVDNAPAQFSGTEAEIDVIERDG